MSSVSLSTLLTIGAQFSGIGLACGLVWLVLSMAWGWPADLGDSRAGVLIGLRIMFVTLGMLAMASLVALGITVSVRPGLLR